MSKILIGNAEIIDGTGASPFCGWVLVEGERIRAVSPSPLQVEDAEFVDARGLTLVPGFIDAHAHSDLSLLAAPEAERIFMYSSPIYFRWMEIILSWIRAGSITEKPQICLSRPVILLKH